MSLPEVEVVRVGLFGTDVLLLGTGSARRRSFATLAFRGDMTLPVDVDASTCTPVVHATILFHLEQLGCVNWRPHADGSQDVGWRRVGGGLS